MYGYTTTTYSPLNPQATGIDSSAVLKSYNVPKKARRNVNTTYVFLVMYLYSYSDLYLYFYLLYYTIVFRKCLFFTVLFDCTPRLSNFLIYALLFFFFLFFFPGEGGGC